MEAYTKHPPSPGLCSVYGAQHTKLTVPQGEMLVVKCRCPRLGPPGANITLTHYHPHPSKGQEVQWLSRGDSYGDGLLVDRGHLVVLNASVERLGNYSCSLG